MSQSPPPMQNTYLDQVLQEQAKVDQELRRKVAAPAASPAPGGMRPQAPPPLSHTDEESAPRGHTVEYRITGFGAWRTVVVPPNAYVVHTRRGQTHPVHIGQGISFSFNPYTDAFLVIPAAVQTLLINANCICTERQGILVQAYVQWIIGDIETAYRKLDFSDPEDPMRIVNVQLREQAEAAIKDKVATLSIDEVLSDKEPIIEELTHRLRMVAEGSREESHESGLGLKIVTVQIKEAVVSSARLWQNLQSPFRAEREKLARLAELESQSEIVARELQHRITRETAELEAQSRMAELRARQEREQYDREQAEKSRRHRMEQELERQILAERNQTAQQQQQAELDLALQSLALEQQRMAAQNENVRAQMTLNELEAAQMLARLRVELQAQEQRAAAAATQEERILALQRLRRDIENTLSAEALQAQLIAGLPEIAGRMPTPQEWRATVISGDTEGLNPLLRLFADIKALLAAGGVDLPHYTQDA